MHDPEQAEEAAAARRLGGIRRRRESTLAVAYELGGLQSVAGLRRLLDIIVADGLSLDNGIGRLRVLIAAVSTGARLLEVRDLEARIQALEAMQRARQRRTATGSIPRRDEPQRP
ncbi:MAG: hypothetical protein H0W81_09455 [Chloroflexi bacterium]|nr:hypothetical protein [Chloroflexota bacterium]